MAFYTLGIDQGTTSTKACIYDEEHRLIAWAQQEFKQYFPELGYVEHDPEEIWQSVLTVCHQVLAQTNLTARQIAAVGISNQRETTVVWHKSTGQILTPAIVWQDRRTLEYCKQLHEQGWADVIQQKTGLLIDPYFSGTKIRWILDHVPQAQSLAQQGLLAFGTIESYLVWRLTAGAMHITDVTNASRTLLMNIHRLEWDEELLALLKIPASLLPTIVPNTGDFGVTEASLFGGSIPIRGLAGDQQAAMIGQACVTPQSLKATIGTGAFLMVNTGERVIQSSCRLISTVAYQVGQDTAYALEGSVFNTGSIIKWLRDQMQLIRTSAETEDLARSLSHNDGFYLVPAFTGLGAPYWQADAKAMCCGMTRATSRAHFARGALEAIVYQLLDIQSAMEKDTGLKIEDIRVDGGLTANGWFMQFLADMLAVPLLLASVTEASCMGAALLAAIGAGQYADVRIATSHWQASRKILPTMASVIRQQNYQGWQKAVSMLLSVPH